METEISRIYAKENAQAGLTDGQRVGRYVCMCVCMYVCIYVSMCVVEK